MLDKSQLENLIPHRGAMCLLDAVIAWDESRIHARACSHRDVHNPLRADGRLHGVNLCEFGAQAMAVHGGLIAQQRDGDVVPGLLVSLREVKLHVARIDDLPGVLDIHAQRLMAGIEAMQYAFQIEHAGRLLAQGRAAVMLKEKS